MATLPSSTPNRIPTVSPPLPYPPPLPYTSRSGGERSRGEPVRRDTDEGDDLRIDSGRSGELSAATDTVDYGSRAIDDWLDSDAVLIR